MAGLVPLEVAIKLPNFLSKIPTTDEQGIINDTDRELYIKGFRTCEVAKRKSSDTPLTDLLETFFSWAFFLEAFHSPSIHRIWFKQHGRNSAKRLLCELDDFCKVNLKNLYGLENQLIEFKATIERVNEEEKKLNKMFATALK